MPYPPPSSLMPVGTSLLEKKTRYKNTAIKKNETARNTV